MTIEGKGTEVLEHGWMHSKSVAYYYMTIVIKVYMTIVIKVASAKTFARFCACCTT